MLTVTQAFALALQQHQAGQLAEAEALYRQILAVQPSHADALHFLGVIAHQKGHNDLAVQWIQQVIALQPGNVNALSNLGEAYRTMGRWSEAMAAYRQALACNPDCAEVYNNLGIVLARVGQIDEAVAAYRRALELKPDFARAHNNLGTALLDQERFEEAIASFQAAFKVEPHYADAYINLGNAYNQAGRGDEALAALDQALRLKPNSFAAYYNRGVTLAAQGRFDEAAVAFRAALELDPSNHLALNNLANCLMDLGQPAEAVACFRRTIELAPDDAAMHSNLIYALHRTPGVDEATIAAEQQRWNGKFVEPWKGSMRRQPNNRDPERPLRIGYVSADLRSHPVGRNLRPLFEHHDHQQFQVLCYSGTRRPDALTAEIQKRADLWRSTAGVTDAELVEAIRNDEVDILVDLTQHTAGDRLPVFARQPAPVQVSFAGYPDTTGLETIGYRISDRWVEECGMTEGASRSYARSSVECRMMERGTECVFLIDSFWCYDPCGVRLEPGELPASRHGYVTFGSLTNFRKVNEPLLKLWARVLRACGDSRLLLMANTESHRGQILEFLAREGVEKRHVEFAERCTHEEYLELYRRVDLVLDTFPYNGHTTSLDALWMGVAVVSLAGQTRVSRGGLSVLNTLGLPEWVAHTEDEYVEIATRLASDLPRLAELRGTLRARMEGSVLMDGPRFTRDVEAAYRAMWRRWCEGR